MAHPTTEERVAAEEERFGRRLPESLRRRLIEDNGGDVWTDERYSDEGDEWQLIGVADVVRDKKGREWMGGGFSDEAAWARKSWGEHFAPPEGTAIIGGNGTADLLLLLPDDRYAWWDHETGEINPVGVRLYFEGDEYRDRAE